MGFSRRLHEIVSFRCQFLKRKKSNRVHETRKSFAIYFFIRVNLISAMFFSLSGDNNTCARALLNDEETYAEKRARNNAAVKKSREKAKGKKCDLRSEIEILQREIAQLEEEEVGLDCDIIKLKHKILKK